VRRFVIAQITPAAAEDTRMLADHVQFMARRDAGNAGLDHDPDSVTWKILPPTFPHLYDEDGALLYDDAGDPVPAPWGLRVQYDATEPV
jgi:hypothetical protein